MGDILSYSRLLALGLSSSVIAMVANIVAQLIRGSKFNPISWIFSVVVLVAFHGLNIALNCLGGFVHSMRLQFVEFFKNFYEGGGKPFLPFKRVYKYSIIVKD
ncbi:MAG TPA: V-type ATPase 116kDa subunit family protein [Exilispira sp.]|nr:V-type ATPase 116kDa subunit family protein [Exilispira sp.]